MGVCCCSLAGTLACKYCSNNPEAERPPIVCTYTTVATDPILITGMKTNADKIRAMSDEELAEWFGKLIYPECVCCPANGAGWCGKGKCKDNWLDWLKKECDT